MNIEILNTLEDLSKKPTTELAMRLMETIADNMAKDKELERYKNIIDELERYIKATSSGVITENAGIVGVNATGNLLNKLKELKGE